MSIGNPLCFSICMEFVFLNVCTIKINLAEISLSKVSQIAYNKHKINDRGKN